MTEFEINKKVAEKLGVDDDYGTFTPLLKYSFDPCNNVQQAWEIMMMYGITIVFQHGKYQFATYDGEIESNHKKTTRRSNVSILGDLIMIRPKQIKNILTIAGGFLTLVIVSAWLVS